MILKGMEILLVIVAVPTLQNRDRLFWSLISRVWKDWRSALVIVRPDTVIRWQKKRFRDFWRRKSVPGRPRIDPRHIQFILPLGDFQSARFIYEARMSFCGC